MNAYGEQNKHYDLRRRPGNFKLGDRVWRKNYSLSDASKAYNAKLAPRYKGPFSILKKISPWTFELVDDAGKSDGVWHAKDLKSHPPDK